MTSNPLQWKRRLFPTARRLLVERDVRRFCGNTFRNVLVIGAGHDPYRRYFTEADLYVALDIMAFQGVTDVVADAVSLPFKQNSFDCCMAIEIMEHVSKPLEVVREVHRVLCKGGTLFLSVPYAYHQHGDPYDYWRPTRHALQEAMRAFEESTVYSQGNRLHVISDFITTAYYPLPLFVPFRVVNRAIVRLTPISKAIRQSTAPSGFFAVARK